MLSRTYLYKLTSDRGGAPSAPPPRAGEEPLLTLSICKPAIRRTAQPGDRVIGVTSHSLVRGEGYPPNAVIYAAVVEDAVDAREYYAARSPFRHRPDCIYEFHRRNGTIEHSGRTPLHADPAYRSRDIGQYPFYKNGRTLLSRNFRYLGSKAMPLADRFPRLAEVVESLGQGHRIFRDGDPEGPEIDMLFRLLWRQPTRHTPAIVLNEAYDHAPRGRLADAKTPCQEC